MLTVNITNNSGTDIVAGDGVLPAPFAFMSIADTANADAVIQVHDLDRIEDNHSGFTAGELLQQLVQKELIAVAFTDLGSTDRSVPDDGVATAA